MAAGASASDDADAADSLPIEDRYADDGSLDPADTTRWSLRTGTTVPPPMRTTIEEPRRRVTEAELVREMHHERRWMLVAMLATMVVVGAAFGMTDAVAALLALR